MGAAGLFLRRWNSGVDPQRSLEEAPSQIELITVKPPPRLSKEGGLLGYGALTIG